jgi:hypothetical protein
MHKAGDCRARSDGDPETSLEFFRAGAGQPGAITAQRDPAVDVEPLGKGPNEALAYGAGDGPQDGQRQLAERLLEAGEGLARAPPPLVQGAVEGPGRLEALGQGLPGAPGHDQQDKDQRLHLPAQGAAVRRRLLRLLPDLGCEKVTEALQERLRRRGRRGSAISRLGHEPFLRCG